jgi:hypothetical protein
MRVAEKGGVLECSFDCRRRARHWENAGEAIAIDAVSIHGYVLLASPAKLPTSPSIVDKSVNGNFDVRDGEVCRAGLRFAGASTAKIHYRCPLEAFRLAAPPKASALCRKSG